MAALKRVKKGCLSLLFGLLPMVVAAAESPDRVQANAPFKVVVGFPVGGGADTVARVVIQKMASILGRPGVVENRPGASGNIAAEYVARSQADGQTLYLATASNAVFAAAVQNGEMKLRYDIQNDFVGVGMLVRNQNVLVANPRLQVRNLTDVLTLARQRPGALNFGVMTTASQLAGEMLRQMGKVNVTDIPYKGAAPVITDLIGGQVDLAILDLSVALPQIQSGQLKAIAVTSAVRFPGLPDVPTFAESGVPGYEASGWLGLLAPAGTPPDVVRALHDASVKALEDPEVVGGLAKLGVTPAAAQVRDFQAFIRAETDKWFRVIRSGNIRVGG